MRRGLSSRLLAHGLGRAQTRGIQRFTEWAKPLSLPVFQIAGFVLVEWVRTEFSRPPFGRTGVNRLRFGTVP